MIFCQASGGGGMETILMVIAMFAIIYFMMIRPQQKERKRVREFQDSLKPGDKVMTAGGIIGKVKSLKDSVVNLEVTNGVVISVIRTSISAFAEEKKEEDKKEEKK